MQRKYAIALTAALGLFMGVLDDTVVNVALSKMAAAFNPDPTKPPDFSSIQWVSTAYLLVQAAVIPAAGYFSIRFGIKRLFLGFLAIFTFGSLLCGLSDLITNDAGRPYLGLLIGARIIQGIGAGALFPLAFTLSLGEFAPEERSRASGIIAGPILVAPILGPFLGGWLTDNFGWQSIFFVNVPIGIIAVLLGLRIFPRDNTEAAKGRGFDYVGIGLVMAGTVSLIYGLNLVAQTKPDSRSPLYPTGELYGWGYPLVWVLLVIGFVLLAAFVVWELRHKDPVLDVGLFKDYNFAVSNVISWFNALIVFGSLLLLPVFFQQVRLPPLTATESGLSQVPQGIGSIIGVVISALLYSRLGPRIQVSLGLGLIAVSCFFNTSLTNSTNWYDLTPWLFLRGLGFSMTFVPIQTLSVFTLTGETLAKANSMFNVTRAIFSSAGTAAVITLFTQQSNSHFVPLPANAPQQQVFGALSAAQTTAVNDVFLYVTIGTVLIMIASFILIPSKKNAPQMAAQPMVG